MKRPILALAGAVALGGVAATAFAADTVTQSVNAGTLTGTVADVTLTAVNYSHSDQTNAGTLTLTVDDSRGVGTGWNVTIQAGAFTDGSNSIAASNFSVTSAGTPTATAGQAVDATNGPKVPATTTLPATLDTARKVIQANSGYGQGTYTQSLGVSLVIPGQTKAGTYTSTLTTTATDGP